LEAGDGEAVLGWDGGFQYYQAKRKKTIICFHSIPESSLTTLKDTATPVTIDNDASIPQTTNGKNSKPGI
jgi:hypothetical protein